MCTMWRIMGATQSYIVKCSISATHILPGSNGAVIYVCKYDAGAHSYMLFHMWGFTPLFVIARIPTTNSYSYD